MARKKMPEVPTLSALADAYIKSIQMGGRSGGTASSYAADLKVALKYLGAETDIRDLNPTRVAEFFDSPAVTKRRNGAPKNPISVAKTRRILRLALCWAVESGWIDVAPLPLRDAKSPKDAPADTGAEPDHDAPIAAHNQTPAAETAATSNPDEGAATTTEDAPLGPGFNHPLMAEDADDIAKKTAKKAKTAPVSKAAKKTKKAAAAAK